MIGSLIGAAVSVAGSVIGGIKAKKAAAKAQKRLEQREAENQSWYDRRYNEDALQRSSAQRILQMTRESIRQRNQQAAGTQAVMGGTDESVASTKAANNEAMADAMSRIAVEGERDKQQVEQQYMANKERLSEQMNQIDQNKAQNITSATQGLVGAAAKLGSAIDAKYDNAGGGSAAEGEDKDEENKNDW